MQLVRIIYIYLRLWWPPAATYMHPGAPPKSRLYVYTGPSPGEMSSLITDPPGTPVIPCFYKDIIHTAPPSKFYVCFPAFHTHTHTFAQALLLNIKIALQCIIYTKRQQKKNPKTRMEGISNIPSLPSSQVPSWMDSSDSPVLRLAGRHAGNLEISAFSGKMTMQRQVRRGDQP